MNLDNFGPHSKNGKKSKCKKCLTGEARARYRLRATYIRETKLASGCVECGYRKSHYSLHFHHIDPSQKHKKLKGGSVGFANISWNDMIKEIEICEILCANCHGEKHEGENMIYFDQYQKMAKKTAIYPPEVALEYLTLGLVGEAGEVANKVKKVLRDGRSTDDLGDEIGDTLWYIALLADELGLSLSKIADNNLKKLADRQERGALQGSGDTR